LLFAIAIVLAIASSSEGRVVTYPRPEFSGVTVPTPRGYLPIECVHEVPSGSHATKLKDGSVHVVHKKDGFEVVFPPCGEIAEERPKRQVSDNGWVAYGFFDGTSFTSFNGTWKVPKSPSTTSDNQTLFMFTGLEDSAGDEIIQPVIQWGFSAAGGGQYWTLANWWVTSSDQALFSTLVPINVGDLIYGTMVQSTPTSGSWNIAATVNGKNPSNLQVSNIAPQGMASVTLEVYNVFACTDYPASPSIVFSGLKLADQGVVTKPVWSPATPATDCQQAVSSTGASTVTITF